MAKKEGLFISAHARTCVASRQHTLHLAHISGKTLRYKSTLWVRLAWMPMFPGACHLGRTEVLCPFIGVKWRCCLPRAALPPQGCICPPLDSDATLQDVILSYGRQILPLLSPRPQSHRLIMHLSACVQWKLGDPVPSGWKMPMLMRA